MKALDLIPEWTRDALCAQVGGDFWFPEKAAPGSSAADAKKVCAKCTVREQCLAWALENDERFGIFGGLTERERRKIRVARHCKGCGELLDPKSRELRCEECREARRRETAESSEKALRCIQCGIPATTLRCSQCAIRHGVSLVQPRQASRSDAA